MSRGLTAPELEREFAKLKKRVSDLERVLRGIAETAGQPETIFSLHGELMATDESGPYRKQGGGRLVQILAGILVAGTTETEILVRKNTTVIATVTIAAGDLVAAVTISQPFGPDTDYLTVELTEAGEGAESLVVQGRWRPAGTTATDI